MPWESFVVVVVAVAAAPERRPSIAAAAAVAAAAAAVTVAGWLLAADFGTIAVTKVFEITRRSTANPTISPIRFQIS